MNHPALEGADLVAHGVGRPQDFQDPSIESSLVGTRRHLYDHDGSLGNALAFIVATRVLSFHLFENHRFAHAAVSVEQHAGHSGTRWIVESSFELFDGDSS